MFTAIIFATALIPTIISPLLILYATGKIWYNQDERQAKSYIEDTGHFPDEVETSEVEIKEIKDGIVQECNSLLGSLGIVDEDMRRGVTSMCRQFLNSDLVKNPSSDPETIIETMITQTGILNREEQDYVLEKFKQIPLASLSSNGDPRTIIEESGKYCRDILDLD
mgnify:CR=1 FL=1